MRFHPDSDQRAIQDTVYGAVQDALPREQLMAFLDADADMEPNSWKALMDLGFAGLMLDEGSGGSGLGLFEAALSAEALGRSAAPGPWIGQSLTALALSRTTNSAAREAFQEKAASGASIATLAFGGDWLPETWTVEADAGRASGNVRFVQSAGSAALFLTGLRGGGLALIEAGTGVKVDTLASTDRTRKCGSVVFEGAAAHVLFEAGDPFVQRIFDAGLVLVAADALGGAQHCVDLSVAYAQEREQFGQVIARFQALKHQLANMAMHVEPARALLWYAAYAWDNDLPDAPRAAAIAKAHICDRFTEVSRDAIAAHGGIGYTWEYGLNIWFRRSVFDRAVLGSPAVHRARAASFAGW
jgi:alkylation response protein AidB-like acyl-CoA dehydrogenase